MTNCHLPPGPQAQGVQRRVEEEHFRGSCLTPGLGFNSVRMTREASGKQCPLVAWRLPGMWREHEPGKEDFNPSFLTPMLQNREGDGFRTVSRGEGKQEN